MEELSAYPNVAVKLSGLVTEADWKGWTPEQLVPYGERTLGWFGAGRILFGSDWPVCILASTYEEVFATYRQLVRDLVPAGRGARVRLQRRTALPVVLDGVGERRGCGRT